MLATDSACMLMIGPTNGAGERRISLCQPDLALNEKPFSGIDELRDEDVWSESKRLRTTITLRGAWQFSNPPEGAETVDSTDRGTTFSFACQDGMTVEADIRPVQ